MFLFLQYMENYTIVLLIMALMLGASALAEKIRIPGPILLIIVGMAVGFVPSMPEVELDPEIIMLLFLPPLLYDAAFHISFKEFRTNINTISILAIWLVFLTAAGIAVFAHYFIPGMTWPLAFVVGAILSATDAVAAISITKGLGLSQKALTILEGESLVNDASALIAYRFAVAAVTGISFVWWKASLDFIKVLGGGFLAGLVMAWVLRRVIRMFRTNDMVIISLMLLMPFVTYLAAEHLGVSGVIAVVVLGLAMSRLSRVRFPDKLKQQSRHYWDVNIFMLNGLIFVLIGLQFPVVLKRMDPEQVWPYISYAMIITLVAFGIRFFRVFWQQIKLVKAFRKNHPRVQEEALFDSRTSLIITWSGLRGIVSLAIAIGLPEKLDNGAPFPMRNEIIFLSIAVVIFSLIGQGLSLPWVVRKLYKNGTPG